MTNIASEIDNDPEVSTADEALQAAIDMAASLQMDMLFEDNSIEESAALQERMGEALEVCNHAIINVIMSRTRQEIQDKIAG